MSGTDQLMSLGPEEPEFFAELLSVIRRPVKLHILRHKALDTLNTVADISLCKPGNVCATMASLKNNGGTLETRLYVVFNHKDVSSHSCAQHLQNIFNLLHRVPYKPPATDSSPKMIWNESNDEFINICRAIHTYSFEIFHHRVTKREHKLSIIRGYIEQDPEDFSQRQALLVFREPLLLFLEDMDQIIMLTKAQTTKSPSIGFIKIVVRFYLLWTKNGLLPKDPAAADNQITLLDNADAWLGKYHDIGFQLRRWALKTMSFVISAIKLFSLTQSNRLPRVTDGNFSIKVLRSRVATPYRCPLSIETAQMALDAAAAQIGSYPNNWDVDCESFYKLLLGQSMKSFDAVHWKPTVHAELAMIMAMTKGEIEDVLPYIGVSKLSCTMCDHYINAFNEVWEKNFVTKGSRGKAYAGWFWPILPDHDEELRQSFLLRVRWQLYSDFELLAGSPLSDSSVGSGGPQLEVIGCDRNETYDLIAEELHPKAA